MKKSTFSLLLLYGLLCCPLVSHGQPDFSETYRLAKQGDIRMQGTLGMLYCLGQGVPQNYTEAIKWFRMAAEQGDPPAQFHLGECYHKGLGVPQDHAKALKWIRSAAKQGHAAAQLRLASIYSQGQGVTANQKDATAWLTKARNTIETNKNITVRNTETFSFSVEKGSAMDIDGDYPFRVKHYAQLKALADRGDKKAAVFAEKIQKGLTEDQITEGNKLAQELTEKLNNNQLP